MNISFLSTCISKAHQAVLSQRYEEAFSWCHKALEIEPQLSEAWYNLGLAHAGRNQQKEAKDAFLKASSFSPESAEAQNSIGLQLANLNFIEAAEQCLNRAHVLNPKDPEPFCTLALIRRNQNRLKEAASLIINAINLSPNQAVLYVNLSSILARLKMYEDSISACHRAIRIEPNLAEAWNNLSVAHCGLLQHKDALNAATKAYELNPRIKWLLGSIIQSKLKICDWNNFSQEKDKAISCIKNGETVVDPGIMLSITDNPIVQKRCAEIYSSQMVCANSKTQTAHGHDRIRVGYISSDFRTHAVTFLTAGLIEHHDRSSFEIHGFDTGSPTISSYRDRILNAFDKTHALNEKPIEEIVKIIKDHEIDILIDLNGYTIDSTTEVLAAKPAPIQINFIGYPGTMGASFMDYIIGDNVVIPSELTEAYSEKIIRLPHCFQPNDQDRKIAQLKPRKDYGLSDTDFIFACFNQPSKITPDVFNVWLSALREVADSKIWLAITNKEAQENLLRLASTEGISTNRIIFADHVDYAEHLMRHRLADLILDTFPFGGGTTTSDALWAGSPIVTIKGETFASRMSASLLNSINMNELVTSSLHHYQQLIIKLSTNRKELAEISYRLRSNVQDSPLFKTAMYTRNFEAGLKAAFNLHRKGLPPSDINVACQAS